jgi:NAD(P)-dependent dehydrogenase (short-subunit alcohol dehydrogenase family)
MNSPVVALVTGANRGIGYAIARGLAQAGMRVIATARDAAAGRAAEQRLAGSGDLRFETLAVDDDASVAALRDRVLAEHGRVDVLVNNAGILPDHAHDTLDVPPALMREVLAVNTLGPLVLAQAFMPGMFERNYGRVINISSTAGQRASQNGTWPAYHLSKFALNGLTLQLAGLARGRSGVDNVLVNAMCPGWVHSDMGGSAAPRTLEQGADTALWLAQLPAGASNGGFFSDRKEIPW